MFLIIPIKCPIIPIKCQSYVGTQLNIAIGYHGQCNVEYLFIQILGKTRDSVLRCICALILVNKPQLIIHECLSTENAVKVRNWCRFLFTIFEMSGSASAGQEVSFTKVTLERQGRLT